MVRNELGPANWWARNDVNRRVCEKIRSLSLPTGGQSLKVMCALVSLQIGEHLSCALRLRDMREKSLQTLYILLCLLFPFVSYAQTPPDTTAFTHVNLISMETDQPLEDQTVVVQGSKILEIGPSNKVLLSKNVRQIDGSVKYLIPGLADLHVHLFSPDDLLSYLANGVTTVMNMDGGPMHLQWRDEVRRGVLLGPTIYTAGHTTDGFPPLNEMFLTAEKPDDARAIVREQKQAGYDFIKLYGTLRPDVFRAILQAGQQEKIPVVGHVNRQVGALEVLKSSQVLAAHLEDLIFARFDGPPSDPELAEFANAIAASHITVTPNLNVNPANIAQLQDLNAVLKSPEAMLLPPAAYSQWMPANNRNERNEQTAQQIDQMKQVQGILYKLVNLLQSKGVRLVLGTDAAPYGFPGLSAHQELQELVEAGFTPYQALLTATRNSGDFIAENVLGAPRFGTIANGAEADLVLLSANPLENINNTKSIAGVMVKGRWLPSTKLSELRAAADAHSAEIKQRLEAIDSALESGDIDHAQKLAEPLRSETSPWIAEWVLMTKARKLEATKLPAAIRVAQWSTKLYPQSFSSFYLLADLLFEARDFDRAQIEIKKSLSIEPHNAAAINLAEKIETVREPLRFAPAGTYQLQYTNDQSGEIQKATVVIEALTDERFSGKQIDAGGEAKALKSVLAGGDRLWAVAETPMGPMEFRIIIENASLSGYWAAPFGRNGKLTGKKVE
jgi:imidazolonepropionase-like amidohydrolase